MSAPIVCKIFFIVLQKCRNQLTRHFLFKSPREVFELFIVIIYLICSYPPPSCLFWRRVSSRLLLDWQYRFRQRSSPREGVRGAGSESEKCTTVTPTQYRGDKKGIDLFFYPIPVLRMVLRSQQRLHGGRRQESDVILSYSIKGVIYFICKAGDTPGTCPSACLYVNQSPRVRVNYGMPQQGHKGDEKLLFPILFFL